MEEGYMMEKWKEHLQGLLEEIDEEEENGKIGRENKNQQEEMMA